MKNFQERFRQFISEQRLFQSEDKIIIGVSGGIDSVALVHLFSMHSYNFAIAHCNFGLRGDDSDGDENFVKNLAENYKVPFYSIRFETSTFAKQHKISIQMSARKLRFDWFEEIRKSEGYKYVALAHHGDDEVETFFINMIRGTGIAGLSGLKPKHNNLLHPLLFASRKEIENFISENNLQFREDKSNLSKKYLRNKLRLDLIPQFEQLNPSFKETIKAEIKRLKDVNTIFQEAVKEKRKALFYHAADDEITSIYIAEIKKLKPLEIWMFELLSPFRFNIETIREVIDALDGPSGKQFFSETHRLVKDREMVIISEKKNKIAPESIEIKAKTRQIAHPLPVNLSRFEVPVNFKIPTSPFIACLDASKVNEPLQIRLWQHGDKFIPLGMSGFKKVSDFLIDLKIPLIEKEKVFVLTSNGEIVWVIGFRIDNRFKYTSETREILQVILNPANNQN
jgi:tRNA(Ile)-lysidine synthase